MGDFRQTKAELNTRHTASTLPYTQDAIPNAGETGKAEAGDQKLGTSNQTLRRKAEMVTWIGQPRDQIPPGSSVAEKRVGPKMLRGGPS